MESSLNRYQFQYSKNKRRLIQQNIKVHGQVEQIKEHIDKWYYEESLKDPSLADSDIRPVLDQISLQEKLIRKLKHQIQLYKLERAKDNVEYIVREEDQLKIMRKQELKLMDQKSILEGRKIDKKLVLEKDIPYQTYEKNFLEQLTEVIHYNRQQAAKITQIQRQIRKYHMIKKSKDNQTDKIISPDQIIIIQGQIAEKVQAKKGLENQWKPHFSQMDSQFASLTHQASKKKELMAELEREQKNWETRVSALLDSELVMKNKSRINSVKVSTKLRNKIADYIQKEESKHVKKVNEEQLKYQFVDKTQKEEEKKKADTKPSNSPPPLPGQKKKQDKIIETLHNDKNITKKVEKPPKNNKNPPTTVKNSQQNNTQVTIPPKKLKKGTPKQDLSSRLQSKKSLQFTQQEEQQGFRHWQKADDQVESPVMESIKSTPRNNQSPAKGVIQLKEVGITTVSKNWEQS